MLVSGIKKKCFFFFFDVTEAKAAPKECFIDVNSKGDRFGNCGFSGNEYKKCAIG